MTDKVLCPWCGHEMYVPKPWLKGTPDMEGHNWTVRAKCRNCNAVSPDGCGRTEEGALKDMMRIALRRYEPPVRPLTMEDFKEYAGSLPVWVDDKGQGLNNAWIFPEQVGRVLEYIGHRYGKTWRCWPRKPTDEEREAYGWEDE